MACQLERSMWRSMTQPWCGVSRKPGDPWRWQDVGQACGKVGRQQVVGRETSPGLAAVA